jgi:phosphohistidine swiveling domain-containing protein
MNRSVKLWDAVPGNDWDEERELKEHPTWALDPTHSWPRLMPMEAWFWMKCMNQGYAYANEAICKPISTGALRRAKNGADYLTLVLVDDEAEVKKREIESRERILSLSASFPEWWDKSKKELVERYSFLKAFDPDNALNIELLDHLYDLEDIARKMWKIHFLGLITVINAWVLLEDLSRELWGLTDLSTEFQKIMSGYDNKMMQVDRRMWELARSARGKRIIGIINKSDPNELFQNLEQTEEGRQWVKEFRDFLEEDGHRTSHLHVFHEKTWFEEPTPAIQSIRGFIEKGDVEFAPEEKRKHLARERQEMTASLVEKLPSERKDEFMKLLPAAQLAGMFNEEHTYYCENYCHSLIRRGLLGIGRRLVKAKVIEKPEDVLMLNPPELERVLPGPEGCDLRDIVDRRRKEWEEWHKEDPPRLLTSRGSIEEAFQKDISKWKEPMLDKIVAGIQPEIKASLNADLYGLSVSHGVAEGPARVVMMPEQLAEVEAGDVLVAPFTTTTWTPVFSLISAVVTDAGGALCHTAIISRELNIPAVTNVGEGTKKIRTGQKIRVDGSEGTVYILD